MRQHLAVHRESLGHNLLLMEPRTASSHPRASIFCRSSNSNFDFAKGAGLSSDTDFAKLKIS
jgi:hypothetical protein